MSQFLEGLPIAGGGFLIVFIVLAIIWGVLELMHVCVSITQKQKKVKTTDVAKVEPVPVYENVEKTADIDDEELIAVFTAAIAASLNTSTYNLRIKSFRRVGDKVPVWNEISRKENIEIML